MGKIMRLFISSTLRMVRIIVSRLILGIEGIDLAID